MSDSIELSEKHGLNPCIPICFWCRKEKDEIKLLGKLKDDMEAPRAAVLDYEPCKQCASNMGKGITFVVVKDDCTDGQPPISEGAYPTGAWAVLKEDSELFKDLIKDLPKYKKESIIKSKKCIIDHDTLIKIIKLSNPEDEICE